MGKRKSIDLKDQIADEPNQPIKETEKPVDMGNLLSTGSTLLDLAISGTRTLCGGIPGGILVEVFGKSGAGKTAILAEVCASAQGKGGEVMFNDPEGRLDREYAQIYGMDIPEELYRRSDTVTDAFADIKDFLEAGFRNDPKDPINVAACDSLAALSTDLELEKGDKMGMRRAKEFSQETRKNARLIANSGNLVIASNQIRQGDYGDVAPGGNAVPFYASLRLKVIPVSKIERKRKLHGKEHKKIIGIQTRVEIVKSSVDVPHRSADIFIVFGYGIDDLRGNLQFNKDFKKETRYVLPNGKAYQGMDQAIEAAEKANLEEEVRQEAITNWKELQSAFDVDRKKKRR